MFQKIGVPKNPHVHVVRVEKNKGSPARPRPQAPFPSNIKVLGKRTERNSLDTSDGKQTLPTDQQTWPPWPLKIPIHGKSPPKGF